MGLNDLTVENNVVYDWGAGLLLNSNLVPGGTGLTAVNGLVVDNNSIQRTQTATVLSVGGQFDPTEEAFSGNRYDSAAGSPTVSVSGSPTTYATWMPAARLEDRSRASPTPTPRERPGVTPPVSASDRPTRRTSPPPEANPNKPGGPT